MVPDNQQAYIAITRLQAAYADVVSRRAWDELEMLFEPQTPIHIDTVTAAAMHFAGPEEFGEFVRRSTERFEFFEFVVLNTVVEVRSDDTATGRLWMVELRQDRATGGWSNAFGVYQDVYALTGGAWRFRERHYQSLARTGRAEVFPFPASPF